MTQYLQADRINRICEEVTHRLENVHIGCFKDRSEPLLLILRHIRESGWSTFMTPSFMQSWIPASCTLQKTPCVCSFLIKSRTGSFPAIYGTVTVCI